MVSVGVITPQRAIDGPARRQERECTLVHPKAFNLCRSVGQPGAARLITSSGQFSGCLSKYSLLKKQERRIIAHGTWHEPAPAGDSDQSPIPAEESTGPESASSLQGKDPTQHDASPDDLQQKDNTALPAMPRPVLSFLGLIGNCWRLLRARLGAFLILGLLQDATIFALEFATALAANSVAVALFGANSATFESGGQWVRTAMQGLVLVVKLAVQAAAACALMHLAISEPTAPASRNPVKRILGSISSVCSAIASSASSWRRVTVVVVMVVLRFLPLGLASALLLPLPWMLPRIIGLQAAAPAAFCEGLAGKEAVQRSQQLVAPHWKRIALPIILLTVTPRLAIQCKTRLLAAMPERLYTQVGELPLLISIGIPLATMILLRMQELLPLVAYKSLCATEQDQLSKSAHAEQELEGWLAGDQPAPQIQGA